MVNLAQARRHFRDRVAEEGVEFWGEADVLRYLNLTQDFIASTTSAEIMEEEKSSLYERSWESCPAGTTAEPFDL